MALPVFACYTGNMKPEFWAIVTVGIALAGLSVTGNQRLTTQIEQLDQRLTTQIEQLDVRVRALETQVARIEGRLIPPLTARTDPPAQ